MSTRIIARIHELYTSKNETTKEPAQLTKVDGKWVLQMVSETPNKAELISDIINEIDPDDDSEVGKVIKEVGEIFGSVFPGIGDEIRATLKEDQKECRAARYESSNCSRFNHKIKNEKLRAEIVLMIAESSPYMVISLIREKKIESDEYLYQVAMVLLAKQVRQQAKYLVEFLKIAKFENQDTKVKLVLEIAKTYPNDISQAIKALDIRDENTLYQICEALIPKGIYELQHLFDQNEIQDETLRFNLAMKIAESLPNYLIDILGKLKITNQDQLAKLAGEGLKAFAGPTALKWDEKELKNNLAILLLAAQKNGYHAFSLVQYLPNLDGKIYQDFLLEVAKRNPSLIAKKIQTLPFQNKPFLLELIIIIAQQEPGTLCEHILPNLELLGITDDAERTQIALAAVQKDAGVVFEKIDQFNLKSEEHLKQVIIEMSNHLGDWYRFNVRKLQGQFKTLGFKNEDYIVEVVIAFAKKDPRTVIEYIQQFGIQKEANLVKIAKELAKDCPAILAVGIDQFHLKDPGSRAEVARALELSDLESLARNIEKFELGDEAYMHHVVLAFAQQKPSEFVSLIRYSGLVKTFKITHEKDREEIALALAKQSPELLTRESISSLEITDRESLRAITEAAFRSLSKTKEQEWSAIGEDQYFILLRNVAAQNGDVFLTLVEYLDIKNTKRIGEILIELTKTHSSMVADLVKRLNLEDEILIQIAEEIVQLPLSDRIKEIKKLGIRDQKKLVEIVVAEINRPETSSYYGVYSHMEELNIESEALRGEIALAIAAKNANDFIHNLDNFAIQDPANFEKIVLKMAELQPYQLMQAIQQWKVQDEEYKKYGFKRREKRFRIEDEDLLKRTVLLCMKGNLFAVTQVIPNIPFQSEESWIEVAIEIAKTTKANYLIDVFNRYPIQSEEGQARVLIEILKNHPVDTYLGNLQYFKITNPAILKRICEEVAKYNPKILPALVKQLDITRKVNLRPIYLGLLQEITSTKPEEWDFKDQEACTQLLLQAAEKDPSLVLEFLHFLEIKDEKNRAKIICAIVGKNPFNLHEICKLCRIQSESEQIAIIFAAYEKNPRQIAASLEQFGYRALAQFPLFQQGDEYLKEEVREQYLQRHSILNASIVCAYLPNFKITSEERRAKIALECATYNRQAFVGGFKNFDLHDSRLIAPILIRIVTYDSQLVAQNMSKFGQLDEEACTEVAIAIAKNNPQILIQYLDQLPLKEEESRYRVALALVQSNPSLVFEYIDRFAIKDQRLRTNIILNVIEKDVEVIKKWGITHFYITDRFLNTQILEALGRKDPDLCSRYADLLHNKVLPIPLLIVLSSDPQVADRNQTLKEKLLMQVDPQDQNVLQEIMSRKIAGEKNVSSKTIDIWCSFLHRSFDMFQNADEMKKFFLSMCGKKEGTLAIHGNDLLFFSDLLTKLYVHQIDPSSNQITQSLIEALFDLHHPIMRSQLLELYFNYDVFKDSSLLQQLRFKIRLKETRLRPLVEGMVLPYGKISKVLQQSVIQFFEKIYGISQEHPKEPQPDSAAKKAAKKEAREASKNLSAEERTKIQEERRLAKEAKDTAEIQTEHRGDLPESSVSLKDAKNEQSVLGFLISFFKEHNFSDEDRSKIFLKLASARTQKEAFEAMKAIPIIIFLRGFWQIERIECKDLPKLVETLFAELMRGQYINNLREKCENTILKFRKRDCLFNYAGQLQGESFLLFQSVMADILNGQFYEHRYSPLYQPHLQTIFEPDLSQLPEEEKKQKIAELKQLETTWKAGEKLTFAQAKLLPEFQGIHFPGECDDFTVEDTDDPNDILLCGEEVDNSCQKITNGTSNNQGLIGYLLNGYNRIVVIKNRNGEIIGRVLFRLYYDKDEKLPVLYQDVLYTNAQGINLAKPLIDAMCQRRAKAMNLILTSTYGEYLYSGVIGACGGRSSIEYSDAVHGLQRSTHYQLPGVSVVWDPKGPQNSSTSQIVN